MEFELTTQQARYKRRGDRLYYYAIRAVKSYAVKCCQKQGKLSYLLEKCRTITISDDLVGLLQTMCRPCGYEYRAQNII